MTDSLAAPWLAANLEALAAALGATVDVGGPGRWHLTTAVDGPVLQLQTASGGLVAAHSRRQPAAEAGRLVEAALDGRPCPPFAMVIGAGLGAVVDDLFARGPGTRVLVIEPDASGTAAFLGQRDWTATIHGGRLLVLSGPDYRGADRAWRLVPIGDTAPVVVVHPVLARDTRRTSGAPPPSVRASSPMREATPAPRPLSPRRIF